MTAKPLDLASAVRTTGSVRTFTSEPVDDATLYALLDDARFAPSGGNRQPWRVAVIKDRPTRIRLGSMMQEVWNEYIALGSSGRTPFSVIQPSAQGESGVADQVSPPAIAHSPSPMLDQIADVPVMLVVAADLRRIAMMDKDLNRAPITGGASVYPFCWNLLLAARSRGLGGVLTTFLSKMEAKAANIVGLPEHHALAATMFIGHPVHQPTKLRRDPVENFTTIDSFTGTGFHQRLNRDNGD